MSTSNRRTLEIRPALESDLEAEHRVFVRAEGDVFAQHRFDWPAPSLEAFASVHRHLLHEDGDRAFVAVDDGEIVGFTAALVRGDTWFFSALFILPDYQEQGIGRELLDRVWTGSFRQRVTITDSFQPHSNLLYARRGLIPMTPILSLAGIPRCDPPATLVASAPDENALAVIDQIAYGFDRSPDHRFWRDQKGAPTVWLQDDEPVAYAYTAASGLIGPLAGRSPTAAAAALRAELAQHNGDHTMLFIPGMATDLVAVALNAGLRFNRPPGLLLLSEEYTAPTAIVISGYWLY